MTVIAFNTFTIFNINVNHVSGQITLVEVVRKSWNQLVTLVLEWDRCLRMLVDEKKNQMHKEKKRRFGSWLKGLWKW